MSREAVLSAHEAELAEQTLEVWPENLDAVRLFQAAGTQWRRSGGLETGLDYTALERPERLLGLSGRRAREAFAGLQVMEAQWLRRARSAHAAEMQRARR